ncbi:MAG: hypothetical protein JXD18_04755 [Anaerolineae bacterium]|nr:hypothetical protein [Anaerolineae bacterium]
MYQLPLTHIALCLSSLLLMISPLRVASEGGASVRLDPPVLDLNAGETAEFSVLVYDVVDLAGAEVHLAFDPAVVEVVDADPQTDGVQIADGDFLAADLVAQNEVDVSSGVINYAVARMPPNAPANGSGRLAVITLRAVTGGEPVALVLQDVLLADPDGLPIPILETDDVPADEAAPSTTSCLPLGAVSLGAVALCLRSRRRQLTIDCNCSGCTPGSYRLGASKGKDGGFAGGEAARKTPTTPFRGRKSNCEAHAEQLLSTKNGGRHNEP